MKNYHSLVWYIGRGIGRKLDALRCLSIRYSRYIEIELLKELEEIRDILLPLKNIMCALSTNTSETLSSNEQMKSNSGKSHPLQNFTNKK